MLIDSPLYVWRSTAVPPSRKSRPECGQRVQALHEMKLDSSSDTFYFNCSVHTTTAHNASHLANLASRDLLFFYTPIDQPSSSISAWDSRRSDTLPLLKPVQIHCTFIKLARRASSRHRTSRRQMLLLSIKNGMSAIIIIIAEKNMCTINLIIINYCLAIDFLTSKLKWITKKLTDPKKVII